MNQFKSLFIKLGLLVGLLVLTNCTEDSSSEDKSIAQTANGQCVAYSKNKNGESGFPIYCGGEYIGALADGTQEKSENNGGSSDYSFERNGNGELVILFHGIAVDTIVNGKTGAAGVSCSTEDVSAGVKVTCDGEVVGVIKNGEKGVQGEKGDQGEQGDLGDACTSQPGENGADIICGGLKVGTLTNGENGASCRTEAVTLTDYNEYYGEFDYIVLCGGEFYGGLRNGRDGKDGSSCYSEVWQDPHDASRNLGIRVRCGAEDWRYLNNGVTGTKGEDGKSCSATQEIDALGIITGNILIKCGDSPAIVLAKGEKGAVGETGAQGESCNVEEVNTTTNNEYIVAGFAYVIKCGDIFAGGLRNGEVCSVNETITGAKITCAGTSVNISNGKNGVAGTNGIDGTSCRAEEVKDLTTQTVLGVNIVCGTQTPVFLARGTAGVDGLGCSIGAETTHAGSEGYWITCGNPTNGGTSAFVKNGITCTATAVAEGVQIQCGANTPYLLKNGERGIAGLDGESCASVLDSTTEEVTITCGGTEVGKLIKGETGDKGELGEKGDNGDGCYVERLHSQVAAPTLDANGNATLKQFYAQGYMYGLICGAEVYGGLRNGAGCTVTQESAIPDSAIVRCDDGTSASLYNGKDCKAHATDDGMNIVCGEDNPLFLGSCSLEQKIDANNMNHGTLINCGGSETFIPQTHCTVTKNDLVTTLSCTEGTADMVGKNVGISTIDGCKIEAIADSINGIEVTCGTEPPQQIRGCKVTNIVDNDIQQGIKITCGQEDNLTDGFIARSWCGIEKDEANNEATFTCYEGQATGAAQVTTSAKVTDCIVENADNNQNGIKVTCGRETHTVMGCFAKHFPDETNVQGSLITCGEGTPQETTSFIARTWCVADKPDHVATFACYQGEENGTETELSTVRIANGDACWAENIGNNAKFYCGIPKDTVRSEKTLYGCFADVITSANYTEGVKVKCGEGADTTVSFIAETTCKVSAEVTSKSSFATISCYTGTLDANGTTNSHSINGCVANNIEEPILMYSGMTSANNVEIICGDGDPAKGGTREILRGCSVGDSVANGLNMGYWLTCGNDAPVYVQYGKDGLHYSISANLTAATPSSIITMKSINTDPATTFGFYSGVAGMRRITATGDTVKCTTEPIDGGIGVQCPGFDPITITNDKDHITKEGADCTLEVSEYNGASAIAMVCEKNTQGGSSTPGGSGTERDTTFIKDGDAGDNFDAVVEDEKISIKVPDLGEIVLDDGATGGETPENVCSTKADGTKLTISCEGKDDVVIDGSTDGITDGDQNACTLEEVINANGEKGLTIKCGEKEIAVLDGDKKISFSCSISDPTFNDTSILPGYPFVFSVTSEKTSCSGHVTGGGTRNANVDCQNTGILFNGHATINVPTTVDEYTYTFNSLNQSNFSPSFCEQTVEVKQDELSCEAMPTTVKMGQKILFRITSKKGPCDGSVNNNLNEYNQLNQLMNHKVVTTRFNNLSTECEASIETHDTKIGTQHLTYSPDDNNIFANVADCVADVEVQKTDFNFNLSPADIINSGDPLTFTVDAWTDCSGEVTGSVTGKITCTRDEATGKYSGSVTLNPTQVETNTFTFTAKNEFFEPMSVSKDIYVRQSKLITRQDTTIQLGDSYKFTLYSSVPCSGDLCDGNITVSGGAGCGTNQAVDWTYGTSKEIEFTPSSTVPVGTQCVYTFTRTGTFFDKQSVSTTVTIEKRDVTVTSKGSLSKSKDFYWQDLTLYINNLQLKNLPPEGFTIPVVVKLRERDSTVFSMDCNQSSCGVPSFKTQKTPVSSQTTYHYDLYVNGTKLAEHVFYSDPNEITCTTTNTNVYVNDNVAYTVTSLNKNISITVNSKTATVTALNGSATINTSYSSATTISADATSSDGVRTTCTPVTVNKNTITCNVDNTSINYGSSTTYRISASRSFTATAGGVQISWSGTQGTAVVTGNSIGTITGGTLSNGGGSITCPNVSVVKPKLAGTCAITPNTTIYGDHPQQLTLSFTPTNVVSGLSYNVSIRKTTNCSVTGTTFGTKNITSNTAVTQTLDTPSASTTQSTHTYRVCDNDTGEEIKSCSKTIYPYRSLTISGTPTVTACYDNSDHRREIEVGTTVSIKLSNYAAYQNDSINIFIGPNIYCSNDFPWGQSHGQTLRSCYCFDTTTNGGSTCTLTSSGDFSLDVIKNDNFSLGGTFNAGSATIKVDHCLSGTCSKTFSWRKSATTVDNVYYCQPSMGPYSMSGCSDGNGTYSTDASCVCKIAYVNTDNYCTSNTVTTGTAVESVATTDPARNPQAQVCFSSISVTKKYGSVTVPGDGGRSCPNN